MVLMALGATAGLGAAWLSATTERAAAIVIGAVPFVTPIAATLAVASVAAGMGLVSGTAWARSLALLASAAALAILLLAAVALITRAPDGAGLASGIDPDDTAMTIGLGVIGVGFVGYSGVLLVLARRGSGFE